MFREKSEEVNDSVVQEKPVEPDIVIKRSDVKKVEYDVENDRMIVTFYKGRM